MKSFSTIFIAIVSASLLLGCNKSAAPDQGAAASTPMSNLDTLKQAVQKFNTAEGHNPKTLDELVPKYIAKIPDAPAGYRFVYNADTGEVKVSR